MILRLVFLSCFCIKALTGLSQLPYAANGRSAVVEGKTVYYEETGEGMPLLLLHGFGRTTLDWQPYINELAKNHRVIVVDLPGHGRSDLLDTNDVYHHSLAALRIAGFIRTLKLDSLHVMGFSSGGIDALYMASMKTVPIKKMIVIAAQVKFSDSTSSFIGSLGGPYNFVSDTLEFEQLHGMENGKRIARQFYHFRLQKNDPDISNEMLSSITAKTLIIHGAKDQAAPVSNAWTMARYIPRAQLWVWPDADHISIFYPENAELFLKRVKD
ncbi:MAG: alpha/beta fold hydrolase, partial [Flavisolibacter sp.]